MNGLGALKALSDDSGGGFFDSIASLFTPQVWNAPAQTGPTVYQDPGASAFMPSSTYYPSGESQSQYQFRINTTPNPKYAQRNRRESFYYFSDPVTTPLIKVGMDGMGLPEIASTGASYVSPSTTFVNEIVANQTPAYVYPSQESNYQYANRQKVQKAASGNFSDLINGQLFEGIPNWVLLVGVGSAAMVLGGVGARKPSYARRYAR